MKAPKLLMTPGPTIVPKRILKALSKPIMHHRTPEFQEIVRNSCERLKKIYKTQNDVFILASSGTGAMEAALANVIQPGDKVVSAVSGIFSERLRDIALTFGADVTTIDFEWGTPIDVEKVKQALTSETKVLTAVHNETSTGVKNNIAALGSLVKNTNTLFAVDTISSLAGDDIRTDEWNIDLNISGSQKCFMLPPGLAFISVSPKAWNAIENNKNKKTFYFNLLKYREKFPDNPWTSAISLIYGLEESLNTIEQEGLENRVKRHYDTAKYCRKKAKKLGLELFPKPEESCSITLTSIKKPEGIDVEMLRKKINQEHNIMVAGGQAKLKGEIFRIGHMGIVGRKEVSKTLKVLEQCLGEMGFKK